jgi:hypothetical protein
VTGRGLRPHRQPEGVADLVEEDHPSSPRLSEERAHGGAASRGVATKVGPHGTSPEPPGPGGVGMRSSPSSKPVAARSWSGCRRFLFVLCGSMTAACGSSMLARREPPDRRFRRPRAEQTGQRPTVGEGVRGDRGCNPALPRRLGAARVPRRPPVRRPRRARSDRCRPTEQEPLAGGAAEAPRCGRCRRSLPRQVAALEAIARGSGGDRVPADAHRRRPCGPPSPDDIAQEFDPYWRWYEHRYPNGQSFTAVTAEHPKESLSLLALQTSRL